MNEVRWYAQCRSKKGGYGWTTREEVTYSGWFNSTGNDTPTETCLEQFNQAVEDYDYLEWRLVQENRTFTRKIVAQSENE